ncbi:hypothetical protein L1277_000718 [Okibacterium sp. HSC-33S16]|uniref:DUF1648 domain-containing protein n=1 Tax=Okibacterium sp. HSC-33S16 TaxID=2910965 RepID=UPI00209C7E88|nr:DUF1648 domain-containing protein [Okibacterium sp. HSC-33S16]MCP2030654.1 hypothetical protein [Okibacterium sp. HSC-33S16]
MTETPTIVGQKRHLIFGIVIPVLISVVGAIVAMTWLPQLPDTVAIHWSEDGADGYGSPWTLILIPPVITVLFTVATEYTVRAARRARGATNNEKILVATRSFLSVILTTGTVGSLAVQRGLADAADAPNISAPMIIGAIGGLVLAAVVWFILPTAAPLTFDEKPEAEPLDIAPSERVYWARTVHISGAVVALIAVALAVAIGAAILTMVSSSNGSSLALGVAVFVALVSIGMSFWRVRADRRGFVVRGALGWPRVTIPNADIDQVRVVDVNPTADFGGWGWRWAPGRRTGVIMRRGPGIEVTRRDGRRLVVTVDDAETGASVVKTLIARSSARR